MGVNIQTTPINDLTSEVLAPFYKDLKYKYLLKKAAIDKHTRIMRSFLKFLTDAGTYNGANFFKTIGLEAISGDQTTISDDEFEKIMKVITKENGISYSRGDRRNYYKKWLKDVFFIGRHTGLRRAELYHLKWKDII